MEATAALRPIAPRILLPPAQPPTRVAFLPPPARRRTATAALRSIDGSGGGGGSAVNYVVPMDKKPLPLVRPLAEILRDLNKRVPDSIIRYDDSANSIPWYHANRMLSFYAPGWCGEIRNVVFSDNGTVTVVYRVTVRGTDGEAHRESTGTVQLTGDHPEGPVAAAEQIAFCRACARFGLGLYLYHEDEAL